MRLLKWQHFKPNSITSKMIGAPWFACQLRNEAAYNQYRDLFFLAPYWLIERALDKVRRRWPVKHISNVEINRKYATHWGKLLTKAFPQWPGITARICRRFFAVYAYQFFGKSFFMEGSSQSSLIGFFRRGRWAMLTWSHRP